MFGEVGRQLLDGLLLLMQAAVVVLWRGSGWKNGAVGVVGGGVMEEVVVVVVIRSRAACVFLGACELLPKPELPYESLAWRAGSAALGPTRSVANHVPPIHIVPLYTNALLLKYTIPIFDFMLVSSFDFITATRHQQCKAMMTQLQRASSTKLHSLHTQGI